MIFIIVVVIISDNFNAVFARFLPRPCCGFFCVFGVLCVVYFDNSCHCK